MKRGCFGGAEQATFAGIAADAGEDCALGFGVDAGRDHPKVLAARESEESVEQHCGCRVAWDVLDGGGGQDDAGERKTRDDCDRAAANPRSATLMP